MAVGLVVAPNLEKSLVTKRGILTVPSEDATVSCACVRRQPCNGLSVTSLPLTARALERYALEMGDRFIERQRVRGFEWKAGTMRLHGPWPSFEFNKMMADVESSLWQRAMREDDPNYVLPLIVEQPTIGEYMDYRLVGDFIATNVLTEVIVNADEG